MREVRWLLLLVSIAVGAFACARDDLAERARDGGAVSDSSAVSDGGRDAGEDAAADAGGSPICDSDALRGTVGIASAALDRSPTQFKPNVELSGPGADAVLAARTLGLHVLVAQPGGLIAIGDGGFWDIQFGGATRWVEEWGLLYGAVAGDIDGDGDQDVMIITTRVDLKSGEQQTVLRPWERTANGLVQRDDVRKEPGAVVFMPIVLDDVDDDGDLDFLSYEGGAVVSYVNEGAFAFSRTVLSESIPEDPDRGAIALMLGDRNQDGVQDLLVVMGGSYTFEFVVALGDGEGGFMRGVATPDQQITGIGLALGDVTGDGLADEVIQKFQEKPRLRLTASTGATTFAPIAEIEPGGTGLALVDIDGDGTLDIVTEIDQRFAALIARGNGAFERVDLGIAASREVLEFVTEPAGDGRPARLHVLYDCTAH